MMQALNLARHKRPLTIGLSIGTRYGSGIGTLGVFVTDDERKTGFLTTTNALGIKLSGKEEVYQPGPLDAEAFSARYLVGEVHNFTELKTTEPNVINAALVRLYESIETTGNLIPDSGDSVLSSLRVKPAPLPLERLQLNTGVAKVGRTTGYTEGTVTGLMASLRVKSPTTQSDFLFSEIIEITAKNATPFSTAGDTGALVFTKGDLEPIGLVFASGTVSDQRKSYACRLDRVIEIFGVQLVP
jgi:hypothetical protein